MSFTTEELEAMRLADEEIDREYEVSSTDTEISNWLDELAINDTLDHKQIHNKRRQRAYYEAHKDEIAASRRAYYEAHKDEAAAYQRAYREAHKDEIAASRRAYYEAHKDEIAASRRAYREAHKDEAAAYRRAYRARAKNTAPDTAMSESGT